MILAIVGVVRNLKSAVCTEGFLNVSGSRFFGPFSQKYVLTYEYGIQIPILILQILHQAHLMSLKQNQSTKYGTLLPKKIDRDLYKIFFYRTAAGREPVRDWLKQIDPVCRKQIGEDLYTLQLGWPIGMPLVRKLEPNLWELRSHISNGIVRIMFTEKKKALVLLHGFIKKSQKLPAAELALAKRRLATFRTRNR